MKKTMFITSVIMVVVMAIALTTSSLAWFSAQGASTVTTKALTISAQAKATAGLLISKGNTTAWRTTATPSDYVELTTGNAAVTDRVPLVPYGDDALTGTPSDAAIQNEFIQGLKNSWFIGNSVKTEGGVQKFAGDYTTTGYFEVTDLYVANSGNTPIAVSAAINFTETHGATLYVAVLARHEADTAAFRARGEDPDNTDETEEEYAAALTAYNTAKTNAWEVLAFGKSSNTFNTQVGRYAEGEDAGTDNDYFQADAQVSLATAVVSSVPTEAKTTFNLAGTAIVEGVQELYGDYMQVKVLAWYSYDLSNSNSGAYVASGEGANPTGTSNNFNVVFTKETANAN